MEIIGLATYAVSSSSTGFSQHWWHCLWSYFSEAGTVVRIHDNANHLSHTRKSPYSTRTCLPKRLLPPCQTILGFFPQYSIASTWSWRSGTSYIMVWSGWKCLHGVSVGTWLQKPFLDLAALSLPQPRRSRFFVDVEQLAAWKLVFSRQRLFLVRNQR